MNGPVAIAGSIFTLFKNKGIMVPNKAAKIITVINDTLTVSVNANESLVKKLYKKINEERITPLISATKNSFNNFLGILSNPKFPEAIACTIMDED